MAQKQQGWYRGSASLFPACDRTPVQKLERLRRWITDTEEWLEEALEARDRSGVCKAQARLRKYRAVEEVLLIAIRTGAGYNEVQGLIPAEVAA